MIADAKECGEGVSFFGVRRLLLAGTGLNSFRPGSTHASRATKLTYFVHCIPEDVPSTAEEFVQRIGRAVRFLGHAHLPDTERHVEMRLYASANCPLVVDWDAAGSTLQWCSTNDLFTYMTIRLQIRGYLQRRRIYSR